jgi:hypothetical protein
MAEEQREKLATAERSATTDDGERPPDLGSGNGGEKPNAAQANADHDDAAAGGSAAGSIPGRADDSANEQAEEQNELRDPRTADFAMISLNTPRSRAMHGVFAYARWLAKTGAVEKDGREVLEGGFGRHMPEVRELLESKLSPEDDSGFAVRATYGYHFGLLYWIDRGWFEEWAPRICDLRRIETDPQAAYGWGAWNTFLYPSPRWYSSSRRPARA